MAPQAVAALCTGNSAMLHRTKLCKFFEQGKCNRGNACSFAHSIRDLQSRPNLHKTQFCLALQRNGYCRDGDRCKYAHGDADLKANVQQLGDALPGPIGVQVRRGSVASMVNPMSVPVPVREATSISMPSIRGPMSGTSAWSLQPMTITREEMWTCLVTEDDPDTQSTTCADPWLSERNHAFDSDSIFSTDKWDRQVSEASYDSSSCENWRALDIDYDENQPETESRKSNSVNRGPVEEAESPKTGMALSSSLQRTKLCGFHRQGFCKLGLSCKFAHELEELRSRPNLFRTHLCFAFSRGRCKRGEVCKYAHGFEQLQGGSFRDFDMGTEFQVSQLEVALQRENDKKRILLALNQPEVDLQVPK